MADRPDDLIPLEDDGFATERVTPGTPAAETATGGRRVYPEVTLPAVLIGLVVGVVMNAAITYAGLKIGFTIVGSTVAAVLGFGVLKLMRRGTIIETNILQTVASGVNTSNSGVIFTVPVLILLGWNLDWQKGDFWLLTLASVAGAILGAAFIVPLRKQMLDIERLRFPSAVGVATVLKSPGAGVKKLAVLIAGVLIGAAVFLPANMPGIPFFAEVETTARQVLNGVEPSDDLAAQVERGRVSPGDAMLTRTMAQWIQEEQAPAYVVERGRLLVERKALLAQVSTAATDEERVGYQARLDEIKAVLNPEPLEETTEEAGEETGEQPLGELAEESAEDELAAPPSFEISDELAITVYRVAEKVPEEEGGTPPAWSSIKKQSLGWATSVPWGYRDLDIRLPDYRDETGAVHPRFDHDGDNRPDLALTDGAVDAGRIFGIPGQFALVLAITPLSLGAGFITGRPGLMVLVGGVLAYVVVNPIAYNLGWLPDNFEPGGLAEMARGAIGKPLGIGMLLGGAIMGIIAAFPAITAAFKSLGSGGGSGGGINAPRRKRDEMGLAPLGIIAIGGIALLFLAADLMGSKPINQVCPVTAPVGEIQVDAEVEPLDVLGHKVAFASEAAKTTWTDTWTDEQREEARRSLGIRKGFLSDLNPHLKAAIIAVVGAIWIWFAGVIIAQCTGMTDWSPISGMALVTVVSVLLLIGTGQVLAGVLLGVALCTAITLAADMMADLKTGYLVGAKPIKQQTIELAVVGIGPVVCMFTILLISQVYTLGGPEIPAAQGEALKSVINGVQGEDLPYALYGGGAIMGILLGLGGFAGLGVLVGLSVYLPFIYIATYGLGCILNMVFTLTKGKRWVEEWGVPFAAGLIVGEALTSLAVSGVILSVAS